MAIRFSACVEMIFRDLPFPERLERVARAGLPAFEFWEFQDKDLAMIRSKKAELGLACAAFIGSARVPLVDPGRHSDFIAVLREAIVVARELDCTTLLVLTGQALSDRTREEQHAAVVDALKHAAPICEDAGVTMVLEPLNVLVDHKGYYLASSLEGFKIVEEVDSPALRLLYDVYHQQVTEGNLISTITANAGKIGHLHVADVPGRHEPGTGEINYRNVFRAIAAAGYRGYVGLEYAPLADPAESLASVKALASTS